MNNITSGVFLILTGIIFLLERLSIISFGNLIRIYWPVILIIWGIIDIVRQRKLLHSNGLVLVAGISLQIDKLGLLPISPWSLFFSLSLILFGIIEIRRGSR